MRILLYISHDLRHMISGTFFQSRFRHSPVQVLSSHMACVKLILFDTASPIVGAIPVIPEVTSIKVRSTKALSPDFRLWLDQLITITPTPAIWILAIESCALFAIPSFVFTQQFGCSILFFSYILFEFFKR